jgi:zinc D-Ala-D-Ala carboxypeptidase
LILAATQNEIDELNRRLGIDLAIITRRALPRHEEAVELASIGLDIENREQRLTPAAAAAWQEMQAAAAKEPIILLPVSGFRSLEEQIAIIERKLARGIAIDLILAGSAPPGYSEHHSGCAIDIGTPESIPLEVEFEQTPAFTWLVANAARFGFTLSFPRDNKYGYIFEPWHWFHETGRK